jgi:hypothetical protein
VAAGERGKSAWGGILAVGAVVAESLRRGARRVPKESERVAGERVGARTSSDDHAEADVGSAGARREGKP